MSKDDYVHVFRCLTCEREGRSQVEEKPSRIVFDPQITMPGTPTLDGHRLGAEFLADLVWAWGGIADVMDDYELSRADVVACCAWAGLYSGKRRLIKRFGEWANRARGHMWHGCGAYDDPSFKPAVQEQKNG